MSDAPERIITDAEIEKHHFGSWGSMTPREVVNEGVLKYAHGFSSGYTQLQILLSHKLLKKPKPGSYRADLSQKGKAYARSLYKPRADLATPDPMDDPRVKALVEAAEWAFRHVKHMSMDEASQADLARHLATLAAMKGGAGMTDRPEIRRNPDGTIDEICADGVNFHLEQMDNGAWFIGLQYRDGRSVRIWLSARNRRSHVNCAVEVDP